MEDASRKDRSRYYLFNDLSIDVFSSILSYYKLINIRVYVYIYIYVYSIIVEEFSNEFFVLLSTNTNLL